MGQQCPAPGRGATQTGGRWKPTSENERRVSGRAGAAPEAALGRDGEKERQAGRVPPGRLTTHAQPCGRRGRRPAKGGGDRGSGGAEGGRAARGGEGGQRGRTKREGGREDGDGGRPRTGREGGGGRRTGRAERQGGRPPAERGRAGGPPLGTATSLRPCTSPPAPARGAPRPGPSSYLAAREQGDGPENPLGASVGQSAAPGSLPRAETKEAAPTVLRARGGARAASRRAATRRRGKEENEDLLHPDGISQTADCQRMTPGPHKIPPVALRYANLGSL